MLQPAKKIKKKWSSVSGFLLIELIVVLALVAVLLSVAFPVFNYWQRSLLCLQLEQITTDVYYVQQRALITGIEQRIMFQLGENSYTIDGKKQKLATGITYGAPSWMLGPPAQPKHLIVKPISFADGCIKCYPDGTLSSGALYLTDNHKQLAGAITIPIGSLPTIRQYAYKDGWTQLR